jgi:hypothetical protein
MRVKDEEGRARLPAARHQRDPEVAANHLTSEVVTHRRSRPGEGAEALLLGISLENIYIDDPVREPS